ncbi:MAG: chromosome segregation and condensation protein ScpA [Bacteriovoracaceae bacterium]|nr:chromosome segregation and condensation protein ScpA [Bacteriovoracaceae bacterium]
MNTSELLRAPHEEVIIAEKYQVTLPAWTGPYDVLLQVIHDQELNLLDLDISVLLEHYLVYIQNSTAIDIDEAGEFLVVAATLAQIKSKLLLPKEEVPEVEEKDPREDLVRYLQEYQKIKQAAELLGERPLLGRDVFLKGTKEVFEGAETDGRGTLFQLVRGFQKALRDVRASEPMAFQTETVTVSERLRQIFAELNKSRELEFTDLLEVSPTKTYLIITFLALLELVRLKKIKFFQNKDSDGLYFKIVEGAGEEDLVHSEFDKTLELEDGAIQNEDVKTEEAI